MLAAINGGLAFFFGYIGASLFWIIVPGLLTVPALYGLTAKQNGRPEIGAWSIFLVRDLQSGRRFYFLVKVLFISCLVYIAYWLGNKIS